jgi:hypothetical protein
MTFSYLNFEIYLLRRHIFGEPQPPGGVRPGEQFQFFFIPFNFQVLILSVKSLVTFI